MKFLAFAEKTGNKFWGLLFAASGSLDVTISVRFLGQYFISDHGLDNTLSGCVPKVV